MWRLRPDLASFLLGGPWYSDALFKKAWMREAGRDAAALEPGSKTQKHPAYVFGISFVFEQEGGGDPRSVTIPLSDVAVSNRDMLVYHRGDAERAVVRAMVAVAEAMRTAAPPPVRTGRTRRFTSG